MILISKFILNLYVYTCRHWSTIVVALADTGTQFAAWFAERTWPLHQLAHAVGRGEQTSVDSDMHCANDQPRSTRSRKQSHQLHVGAFASRCAHATAAADADRQRRHCRRASLCAQEAQQRRQAHYTSRWHVSCSGRRCVASRASRRRRQRWCRQDSTRARIIKSRRNETSSAARAVGGAQWRRRRRLHAIERCGRRRRRRANVGAARNRQMERGERRPCGAVQVRKIVSTANDAVCFNIYN